MTFHTVTESLYLSVVVVYVMKASLDTTVFQISWLHDYDMMLRTLACAVLFLKLGDYKNSTLWEWLLYILTIIVFHLSWINTGYSFLIDTALLTLGAVGVPYKKILRAGFWGELAVLLAAILGSCAGCIEDLVYLDDGCLRHSFGIVYPTDFAAHIVFLFLAGWVLYGSRHYILNAVCPLILCVLTHYYSNAKCGTIVLFLASAGTVYIYVTEKCRKKCSRVRRLASRCDRSLVFALSFCALLMIVLTCIHDPESLMTERINQFLSNRLILSRAAIDKYGITLFGTPFPQQGFGGTTAWTWALEYNFVDCSYILILIRYGLAVLLIICAQSILIGRKALKHGQRRLLVAMALAAVHSMIEHHLPEAEYNLFILLPFSCFAENDTECVKPEEAHTSIKKYVAYIVTFVCCTIFGLLFGKYVTYMKTLTDIWHLDTGESQVHFITITFCCIGWIYLFVRLTAKCISLFMKKSRPSKALFLALALLLSSVSYAAVKGEAAIEEGFVENSRVIASDASAIYALQEGGYSGTLYVDHLPEIYRREFDGISNMLLPAESLATKENTTLIAEDKRELWILIAAGYKYGELPSGHALYTNSENAASLLNAAGVTLTEHYSRQTTVNLRDLAIGNLNEAGALVLSSEGVASLYGPWVSTVYSGTLQIQYRLRLTGALSRESLVATGEILSDGGLVTWESQTVSAADFDENGFYDFVLEKKLPFNCPNVEFRLSVQDGVELEVYEIRYGKVG